jgi:hypothetical protein
VSRVALHAYAADLEEQRSVIAETMYKCHAVAQDGIAMYDLFKNPAKVHDLSICTLDSVLNTPGGMDVFTSYYLPVITMLNNGGQIEPQQPMSQPQMMGVPAADQRFGWGANSPLNQARASFPAMPQPSGGSGVTPQLEQIAPHERWRALDAGIVS